jgi:hypothetical protein
MRKHAAILIVCALALALGACAKGGGGVAAPEAVQGTWGADCAQPYVKFDGSVMHIFADKADYTLRAASLAGGNLTVAYDNAQGPVIEVYAIEGPNLRLDHGAYGASEMTWHKQPMKKCPG